MKYAVLDVETTGFDPDNDRIVELAVVLMDGVDVVGRFVSFVRPERPLPARISRLTGIAESDLRDAPAMAELLPKVLPLLEDRVLVGHNVGFDLKFLCREMEENGYFAWAGRSLDTADFVRVLFPTWAERSLAYVAGKLGIPHERPHRAGPDAEATAGVWKACLDKMRALPLTAVRRIAELFRGEGSDFAWFWNEMASLRREMEDVPGFRVFRDFAFAVGEWGNDEVQDDVEKDRLPLDGSFAEFYRDVKERLRTRFDAYEERRSQDQMAEAVASVLEEGGLLFVEAGTGTGKTLGYLVPALFHALGTGEKVVVSTHTVNLQEQLRRRDLPLLADVVPHPFRAAVLKGRNRYLCLRKWEWKATAAEFETAEDRMLAAQLIVWLTETETGDVEELSLDSQGRQLWKSIESDADSCLNRACPWFRMCYYHRARHDAQRADIIVTNHALLLTDFQVDRRVLPSYSRLIVDEAHHLEETASRHFGRAVSARDFSALFARLYKDARTGFLPLLRIRMKELYEIDKERLEETLDHLESLVVEASAQWEALIRRWEGWLSDAISARSESGECLVRWKRDALPPDWNETVRQVNAFLETIDSLADGLSRLSEALRQELEPSATSGLAVDVAGIAKELVRLRDDLAFLIALDDERYVYWLEGVFSSRGKWTNVAATAVPVDVGDLLRENVFEAKDSVVLTSATLTVGDSFDYVRERLGLAADDPVFAESVRVVRLSSPFCYREQSLVIIPNDFPKIGGVRPDPAFVERLAESLAETALTTGGRMLVLFTSYRMLRDVYDELDRRLAPHGIRVFGQGVDGASRSQLVRLFQECSRSVLLGTSSFWEGVDIPGGALSCLAIVRLPFEPPRHPVAEAKAEWLKRMNKDPFLHYSVPQAVIRFKQGFGRLIRRSTDRGVAIVYDSRVLEARYGKYFLRSLPEPTVEALPTRRIAARVAEWLKGESL